MDCFSFAPRQVSLGTGSMWAVRICRLQWKGQQKKSMPDLVLPWASVLQLANLVIWQCSFKWHFLLSVAQTVLWVVFIYKISQEHSLTAKGLGVRQQNTRNSSWKYLWALNYNAFLLNLEYLCRILSLLLWCFTNRTKPIRCCVLRMLQQGWWLTVLMICLTILKHHRGFFFPTLNAVLDRK